VSELLKSITRSIEASVEVIAKEYPNEDFFAVALSTDPDLSSLGISVNSKQNLNDILPSVHRATDFDRNYYKWGREEWGKFDALGSHPVISKAWMPSYSIKSKLIEDSYEIRHVDDGTTYLGITGWELEESEPITFNAEYLLSTMCRALAEVPVSIWEKLNARSELLLFCTCEPDTEEPLRWNTAKWLNEGKIKAELMEDFKKVTCP